MKKISSEELKTILENHKHWLYEDCEGWEDMRADLSYANLRGANLRDANLREANLSYANLREADLRGTNLRGANLSYANLSYANLREADLNGTNLRGANLSYANLSYANLIGTDLIEANLIGTNLSYANLIGTNLREADLNGTNLSYANLRGTNLREANLNGTNLRGANLRDANLREANLSYATLIGTNLNGATLIDAKDVPYIPMVCPEEGKFIGWKKAEVQEEGHYRKVIVKLEIPASAKRSSATSRKCRCNKAKVLEIYNLDGTVAKERKCHSNYDNDFIYEVGKIVKVDDFCEDRWNECTQGIHFFINRQEAINYY